MMTNLVSMYQDGAVTAGHLAAECLRMIDPENPGLVLEPLPEEVLSKVRDFIEEYRPRGMVTNFGLLPAEDQVQAARAWIESRDSVTDDNAHDNNNDRVPGFA
jgi:hypothetical protein